MPPISTLVAVIGAGPAGLAASLALAQRKIDHVVLEKGEAVGHSWSNLYESLRLHTSKHMSALPGMPFPRSTPYSSHARPSWTISRPIPVGSATGGDQIYNIFLRGKPAGICFLCPKDSMV